MLTDESKRKGYEVSDAPASPAAIGMFILVGLMFAGFVGGKIFQIIFEATEVKSRPAAGPLVVREEVDGPLVQAYPAAELRAYKAEQARKLRTYGWVDRSTGVVRIPVDRAMELIARDGLPTWEPIVAKLPDVKARAPGADANGAGPNGHAAPKMGPSDEAGSASPSHEGTPAAPAEAPESVRE